MRFRRRPYRILLWSIRRFGLQRFGTTANGYVFYIRLARFVEFAKGQTAVAVPSLDKLATVIDTLIAAVRAGELNKELEAASTKPTAKKPTKK